jgi:hypothetical protein
MRPKKRIRRIYWRATTEKPGMIPPIEKINYELKKMHICNTEPTPQKPLA